MNYICKQCHKSFGQYDFDGHNCVTEAMKLPREELLKRLVKSGGCSQEFFDKEMKKLAK